MKLNNFREMIDQKFKRGKREFFEQIKIYYTIETMILKTKQPLMLRTLRLNEVNFYDKVRFTRKERPDLKPAQFLDMVNGKNIHERKEYSVEMRAFYKKSYFRFYMSKLRETRKIMKSSSSMLLTGVWAGRSPLLRFREHFFCKILEKNYSKKVNIAYLVLKENRNILKMIEQRQIENENKIKNFSYTWSKIWLYTLFKDKITTLCDDIMQNLEIHKRLCRLIEQREKMQKNKSSKTLALLIEENKNLTKVEVKRILEQNFTDRMEEVGNGFPKAFLEKLLKYKGSPTEVKKGLVGLLFDTVFFVVCDVVQQTHMLNPDIFK